MFESVWNLSPQTWVTGAVGFGVILILVGWRGRRISRAPHCRRCGYILVELPSAICPECGLDSARRRPRRGAWKRMPLLIVAGLFIIIGAIGPVVWVWASADWRTRAPVWLLMFAMDFGDTAAETELITRVANQSVVGPELRGVVSRALEVQRDAPLDSTRLAVWLSALAGLDANDALSDEEWRCMVKQFVRDSRLRVRERGHLGQPLPVELTVDLAAPLGYGFAWLLRTRLPEPSKPFEVSWGMHSAYQMPVEGGGLSSTSWRYFALIPHELEVGEQQLTIDVMGTYAVHSRGAVRSQWWEVAPSQRPRAFSAVVLGQSRRGARNGSATVPKRGHLVHSPMAVETAASPDPSSIPVLREAETVTLVHRSFSKDIEISAEPEGDDLEPLRGEAIRSELAAVLSIEQTTYVVRELGKHAFRLQGVPQPQVARPLSYALAYNVDILHGTERVTLGTFHCPEGATRGEYVVEPEIFRGKNKQRVMLILTPAPHLVRRAFDRRYADEVLELGPIDLSKSPAARDRRSWRF